METKWCQNVTQDGSFHCTEDGMGYIRPDGWSDGFQDIVCWNFGRLVPAHSNSYRDEAKTRGSHLLGAHFGHHTCQKHKGFRPFETVLLVILGLLDVFFLMFTPSDRYPHTPSCVP